MRTRWVSSRAWAVALAAAALSAGAAMPAGAATTPGWRITQTYAADSVLTGAVATSASDAWAVGLSVPASSSAAVIRQVQALRRQGTSRARTEAAAVDATTLLRHYNGRSWQAVAAPSGIDILETTQPIAATSGSDAWVAGFEITGNTEATKLAHWNGSKWNNVVSLENSYPDAVVAVNAKDYWAFGSENYAGTEVAWHYTGKKWVTTTIQDWVADAVVFKGTVWTTGTSESTGDLEIQYLSGTKWVTVQTPSVGLSSDEDLQQDAVTSDGTGKFTVAVEVDNENTGEAVKSLLLEYTGSKWSTVTIPASDLGTDTVSAVASDGDGGLWIDAINDDDVSALIHDTKAGKWSKQAAPAATGDETTIVSLSWIPGGTSVWGTGLEGPVSQDTADAAILKYGN